MPSGIVLEQDPAAATPVERGTTVVLTISRGRDTVAVPALTGLHLAQALEKLQAVKLKATVERVASDKPEGQVIAQTPGGGRELEPGVAVELTVSKGKQEVAVPDVVGQDQATATATLEAAGLRVAVLEVASSQPKGSVVAQSPKAGEKAPKGSRVQINVAKRTAPTATVTVPDVVSLGQAAAEQRLQNAGLEVDVRTVPSTEQQGTVVGQFPAAGHTAKRGATIRINVSRGDGTKAVPDVVGLDQATATQKLENAGFTVAVLDQDTSDPTEDGVVLDQNPPAGERRRPGAEITIFVGVLTS
jgi:serine/threonine-protein kinase